jgi:hypothetical protein
MAVKKFKSTDPSHILKLAEDNKEQMKDSVSSG